MLVLALAGACAAPSEEEASGSSSEALLCAGSCSGGQLDGDDLLVRVDRTSGLLASWAPITMSLPEHYYVGANHDLRPEAAEAFVAMLKAAYREGVDLYCMSGYRSFSTQCTLFERYAASDGCAAANTYSAHAGHSEHQLGTVCDIAFGDYVKAGKAEPFVQSGDAGDRWLNAHAWEYGFASSYPFADAAQNDGYIHEPWHYRYIGKAAAAEIHRRGRVAVPVFLRSLSDAERAALGGSAAPPGPPPGPASTDCAGLEASGRCDGTVLSWCKNGAPARVDCAATAHGYTACGLDPNPANGHNCVRPSACLGYSEAGTCTGTVLEWCKDGAYARVDCATKSDGRTRCGADPNPALGNNCIAP